MAVLSAPPGDPTDLGADLGGGDFDLGGPATATAGDSGLDFDAGGFGGEAMEAMEDTVEHAGAEGANGEAAPAPRVFDLPEFRKLGLFDNIVEGLAGMGHESPSPIQRGAIPEVIKGHNLAFAASTGSGKTLAYLLPVVQALKVQEDLAGYQREAKRPRVLVLVPTRELATQVLGIAKQLAHFAKFSSCTIVGGDDYGKQRRALSGTTDVVIASPGRLLKHRTTGHVHLSQVTHVVIDEVDTMLLQGFGPDIKELLGPILFSPQRKVRVRVRVRVRERVRTRPRASPQAAPPPPLSSRRLAVSPPSRRASNSFSLRLP